MYTGTDASNSISIRASFDPVGRVFDYSQSVILHSPPQPSWGDQHDFYGYIHIDLNDAQLQTDGSFQAIYTFCYYSYGSNTSVPPYGLLNSGTLEYFASPTLGGFASTGYNRFDETATLPQDQIPHWGIPTLEQEGQILSFAGDKYVKTSSFTKTYSALWVSNGVFDMTAWMSTL